MSPGTVADFARMASTVDATVPLALLPMRLETRFVSTAPNSWTLRVRVYPDEIHQDAHEPELTDEELAWGTQYWARRWRAAGVPVRTQEAWRPLAQRFGPRRAAWIARELKPLNPADAPSTPIPEGAPLPTDPKLPSVGRRAGSWTRAAEARLLPDRFLALGFFRGTRLFAAVGEPLPTRLPTGPGPDARVRVGSGPAIDDGMRWMTDFGEAMRRGMGLEIPLTGGGPPAVDLLLVLGLREGRDSDAEAAGLAELFGAHQYTDGLALVAPGTPTNNGAVSRAGEGPAGGALPVGAPEGWLADDPPAVAPPAGTDGARVAQTLGLPATAVLDVPGATRRADAAVAAMHRLLWPALGGYYLEHVHDGVADADERGRLRRHLIDFVRGRGAYPALRSGPQPYGLLTVGSLDLWTDRDEPVDRRALGLLRAARAVWRRALAGIPRVGVGTDPNAALLGVLGMDGISQRYAARALLGPLYLDNGMAWALGAGGDRAAQQAAVEDALRSLGLPIATRLARSLYSRWDTWLRAPLAQRGGAREDRRLDPDYIAWLAAHSYDEIALEQGTSPGDRPLGGADEPPPLLYLLLRHAVMRAYADAAFELLLATGAVGPTDRREPELIDIDPGRPTSTPVRHLQTPLAPGRTVAQHLSAHTTPTLHPMRADLAALSKLPSAELEQLAAEALDVCSHRLDAWITALYARRLARMRADRPSGVQIGSYGWVEHLAPKAGALPPGAPGAPATPPDSGGFVHAPSPTHATTAAVLRSAHRSHPSGAFAVDMRSERVRAARWILDGLRQGQGLSDLLGYRVERGLHERGRDALIAAFRDIAPRVAGKLNPAAPGGGAPLVVDGLALVRRHAGLAAPAIPWGAHGLPATGSAEGADAVAVLDIVGELLDAVSDALVAESVFQAVAGNPVRSAASLDALSRGEAPPPTLEFARTPRPGTTVAHRVGWVHQAGDNNAAAAWTVNDGRRRARAVAAPELDAMVATLLPHPKDIRFVLRYEAGTASRSEEQGLEELGVCALDAVMTSGPAAAGQPSELEQRALLIGLRSAQVGETVTLELARDPGWAPDTFSLHELLELGGALRELITRARALDARDVAGASDGPRGLRGDLLRDGPAAALLASLDAVDRELSDARGDHAVEAALLQAAAHDLPEAVPVHQGRRLDATGLAELVKRVQAALRERRAALDHVAGSDDPEALADALHAVVGRALPVLVPFDAQLPLGSTLDRTAQLGAGGGAVEAWLGEVARVRAGAERLERVLLNGAAFGPVGSRGASSMAVTQWPQVAGERWAALPTGTGAAPPGGRTAVVLRGAADVDAGEPLVGLHVDDWVEVVPGSVHDTALTLHFDAPGACAPQAILLAVPPDASRTWTLDALEATLLETIDLAKLRLVDVDALREVGHLVPATHVAFNRRNETVGTDLWRSVTP